MQPSRIGDARNVHDDRRDWSGGSGAASFNCVGEAALTLPIRRIRGADMTATFPTDLVNLAIAAGHEIIRLRSARVRPEEKTDGSLVTEADRAAEAVILDGLTTIVPDVPVVAEESQAAGDAVGDLGTRFVLVDPLDGTREFIDGRSEYTVNIALIERGVPVLGVVTAPALGIGFAGATATAWRFRIADGGTAADIKDIRARHRVNGISAVVSRSHANAATRAFVDRLDVAESLSFGSSLKICRVAEGLADVYPRIGRTMEWDTAAADAVVRAAGGHLVTRDGAPLAYGKRQQPDDAPFANPHFFVFGAWSEAERAAALADAI